MGNRKIIILEFPTNLGLKKKDNELEPNVNYLPDWLKLNGFHRSINPSEIIRLNEHTYSLDFDQESKVYNADKIIDYAINQSKIVYKNLNENTFQIILGGDCSILLGSAIALKKKGNFGLFFLDGHTDYITPEISTTGGVAGMDLAIVTGNGHKKLTNILNLGNYLDEKNIFCVGNREIEESYIRPIINSKINYYDLKISREIGLKNIVEKFLKMIDIKSLDGFFIHFDVDALNDQIMPAVDSRKNDGYSYNELSEILKPLFKSNKIFGIEITILDPSLDKNAKYTKDFILHVTNLLRKSFC